MGACCSATVVVAIANKFARQIGAMLAHDVDYDSHACLNHPTHQHHAARAAWTYVSIHRQRDTVHSRSDHPEENLTNQMDVQTVYRLIPGHQTVRWTNEVFGCGLYSGPGRQRRLNKTDYGNAV